jgi:endonuclease/exonuclease/phosphatase family metal-dependent hydrolase
MNANFPFTPNYTLQDRRYYKFIEDEQRWRSRSTAQTFPQLPQTLRITTFNVLVSQFDDESVIRTDLRHPYQLETFLPEQNSDIICLCEVNDWYLTNLLQQQWVRENYYTTHYMEVKQQKNRKMYVVILSKIPFFRVFHLYHTGMSDFVQRPVVVAVFAFQKGDTVEYVSFLGCHLKAGGDGALVRKQQFIDVLGSLRNTNIAPSLNCCIAVGDMNMQHLEEEQNVAYDGINVVDAWTTLHPNEEGATYDYRTNQMIKGMGFDGVFRFDRVLIANSPETTPIFTPSSIEIIGTEPICEQVFLSDHFGITATLKS